MIIHYNDGTFVVFHLGDLDGQPGNNNISWLKLNDEGEWIRSPFATICETKDYLLSKRSTDQINLDDAVHYS